MGLNHLRFEEDEDHSTINTDVTTEMDVDELRAVGDEHELENFDFGPDPVVSFVKPFQNLRNSRCYESNHNSDQNRNNNKPN